MKIISFLSTATAALVLLLSTNVKTSMACDGCTDEDFKEDLCEGECRRRLVSTTEAWGSIDERCNEKPYDLSLYVNTHVYLVATPKEANSPLASFACPNVVIDSQFRIGKTEATKMVSILDDTELEDVMLDRKISKSEDVHKVPTGAGREGYFLQDIHSAVEDAKVKEDGIYNFFTNNCAVFIKSIGQHLGVTWTESEKAEFREYATNRLMKSEEVVRRLANLRRLGVNTKPLINRVVHGVTNDLPTKN